MRIGEFWGLPAPMLLLAFPEVEDAVHFIQCFDAKANRDILQALRVELCALRRVTSVPSVKFSDESNAVSRKHPDLEWQQGRIPGSDDEFLCIEIVQEVTKRVALLIINGEKENHFVRCSPESLLMAVKEFLLTKTFMLMKTKQIAKEFYSSLELGGRAITQTLVEQFGLEWELPKVIEFNGEKHELTVEAQNVINYYVERANDIDFLIGKLEEDESPETLIFDIPFFDLIKRRPESLRYLVLNRFDIVKTQHNKTALENVVKDVSANVSKYRKCLDDFIVPAGSFSVEAESVREDFAKIKSTFSDDEAEFFRGVSFANFLPSDLQILSDLYKRIAKLDVHFFNELFHCNLTASEWMELSSILCGAWVCGINLDSKSLFADAIDGTTMIHYKTEKPKDVLDEINYIISDIEALVSSIRPIGDVL